MMNNYLHLLRGYVAPTNPNVQILSTSSANSTYVTISRPGQRD